jgi:hypothetical protein
MDKPKIIRGDKWAAEFLVAIGQDPTKNRRVIIDCEVGQPVRIYLENFGDERLYNVRMPPLEVVQAVTSKEATGAAAAMAQLRAEVEMLEQLDTDGAINRIVEEVLHRLQQQAQERSR